MSRIIFMILAYAQVTLSKPYVDYEYYLIKYGYASTSEFSIGDASEAIVRFQRTFDLEVTGEMNDETSALMSNARCGNLDIMSSLHEVQSPSLWTKRRLRWAYEPSDDSDMDEPRVIEIIEAAFAFWSDISKFRFEQAKRGAAADIVITFETYDHGDGRKFDGPGNELGHAFFPWSQRAGIVHLDGSETWSLVDRKSNINLFSVLTHELGHTLGLRHQYLRDSIMFPFYAYWPENARPSAGDKALIRRIYSNVKFHDPPNDARHDRYRNKHDDEDHNDYDSRERDKPTRRMAQKTLPRLQFDSVGLIRGEPFMFSRDKFIRYFSGRTTDSDRALHDLTRMFDFPPNTEIKQVAAVYDSVDSRIIMIIDDRYYAFNGHKLAYGFPKHVNEFGIDDHITHAIPHGRGYVFLIGERSAYKFNEYTQKIENRIDYETGDSLSIDDPNDYALNGSIRSGGSCGLLVALAIAVAMFRRWS